MYLMYDFAHLLKCIRNNWVTEKCGELEFSHKGKRYVAKWQDLKLLYQSECQNLLHLSKLSRTAVHPKPIEKQKVSTSLQIFCDETVAALDTFSNLHSHFAEGTVLFLTPIIKFWKICNVHTKGADVRLKDPRRAVVDSVDDEKLSFSLNLADMADKMTADKKGRVRKLTKETGSMLSHTCGALTHLVEF